MGTRAGEGERREERGGGVRKKGEGKGKTVGGGEKIVHRKNVSIMCCKAFFSYGLEWDNILESLENSKGS